MVSNPACLISKTSEIEIRRRRGVPGDGRHRCRRVSVDVKMAGKWGTGARRFAPRKAWTSSDGKSVECGRGSMAKTNNLEE